MDAGRKLLAGHSILEVAAEFGYSRQTVSKYADLISKGGLEALAQLEVGGRRSVLHDDALRWFTRALKDPPSVHGFEGEHWSDGKARSLLKKQFGVSFSRVYVWQIIRDLGLTNRLRQVDMPTTSGRAPVLGSKGMSWLAAALRHSPKAEGFDANRWTSDRLRQAISNRYGASLSRRQVWLLARELGLSHLIVTSRK